MKIAILFLLIGITAGALYGLSKFIVFLFKNNIFAQVIFDLIYSLSVGSVFLIATNNLLYGEFRLYIIAIFSLGIWLERKTLGKLFAKVYLLVYNVSVKIVKGLKNTRLGKIIFK